MNKLVVLGVMSAALSIGTVSALGLSVSDDTLVGPKLVFLDKSLSGNAVIAQNGHGKLTPVNSYTYELETKHAVGVWNLTAQLSAQLGNGGLTVLGNTLMIESAKDCGYALLPSTHFEKTVTATLNDGQTLVVVSNC